MKEIAVIGFGVVGGGVVSLIDDNADAIRAAAGDAVHVRYILDLRDFPDSPYGDRVVHDVQTILDDAEVSLVVETMGGVHPALEFSLAALSRGKHVVTSNKELVARHGVELLRTAAEHGAAYLYEASVGGGIPLIRSMRTSLAGDTIDGAAGILNGTTNYILTRMRTGGVPFADALAEAQQLGYAERDPSADIHGKDAQRKIMILAAVATGLLVREEDVPTESMANITVEDIEAAARLGGAVRLIGTFARREDGITLSVAPRIVPGGNPLAHIDDVYNGVSVRTRRTGDVLYYGRGAGRFPTAGAVVSDVIAALNGSYLTESRRMWEEAPAGFALSAGEECARVYVRLTDAPRTEALDAAGQLFGEITVPDGTPDGKTEFVTPELPLAAVEKALAALPGRVECRLRLL